MWAIIIYFDCCIQAEWLLYDAVRDLLAIAKFLFFFLFAASCRKVNSNNQNNEPVGDKVTANTPIVCLHVHIVGDAIWRLLE